MSVCKEGQDGGELLTRADIPEFVTPVLKGAELTAEQESKACRMALKFPDELKSPEGKNGRTEETEHGIDEQGNHPVKENYIYLPFAKQVACDKEVEKMLDDDIIEPSDSPWASPVVMVTKKDGSIRFCADYRRLNSSVRKDAYPLPKMDDTLDTLGGSEWFCTMDLARTNLRLHL